MADEAQVAGDELVDEVDLESFEGDGRRPRARHYRIRIDRERYRVDVPTMTGRELLTLAGKTPPEQWMLSQKLRRGQVLTVKLDQVVDFTAPGVERFMTLPLDQTEG